jgi:hypothetical protein
VQQKAVGGEQFDEIKAEPVGASGGVCVSVANTRQTGLVERLRSWPATSKGIADGAAVAQAPASGVSGPPTAVGRFRLAAE